MWINKNQKAITNNTQNVPKIATPMNRTQTPTLVNNETSNVVNIKSNKKSITNNRNAITGEEQKNIKK